MTLMNDYSIRLVFIRYRVLRNNLFVQPCRASQAHAQEGKQCYFR